MANNENNEFVFWLDFWRTQLDLWPKSGHFKCVITKEKIWISPTENDLLEGITVDLPLIVKCKLGHTGNKNHHVILFLADKTLLLSPVHPIDPNGIQNFNHKETSALIKVIEDLRANNNTEINPNPYTRQLAMKNNIKGFRLPDINWDKHTSPWVYYELYGDKFLRLKVFIRNIALTVVSTIFVILLILGIAYALDMLKII